MAGDVGHDEQQVAQLLLDLAAVHDLPAAGLVGADVGRLLEFAELLLELGEHRCQRWPVKANAGGFVLQLERACERRQRDRDFIQNAAWRPLRLWGGRYIFLAFLSLDPLPEAGPRAG